MHTQFINVLNKNQIILGIVLFSEVILKTNNLQRSNYYTGC